MRQKTSNLSAFVTSLSKGEVLLPYLRRFLANEEAAQESEEVSRKAGVIHDAELTIACFKERIKEFNHGEDPKGDFFHPSQIGGCMRRTFFDIYEAPRDAKDKNDDPLKKYMIFEMGTYLHVVIQNLCERAGILVRREVPIVRADLKIIGHADGVLEINGVRYVLEFKTINSAGFSKLNAPKHEHKGQATAYMRALKKKYGTVHAIILYFDKDRAAVKEFVVKYDVAFYKEHVRKRIDMFFQKVHAKQLPDKEGDNPAAFPCMFCAYKRVCWDSFVTKKFMLSIRNRENKHAEKAKQKTEV
jgi:CRISPR/Cas system-associated exonuclease Cas4 (RecB family)